MSFRVQVKLDFKSLGQFLLYTGFRPFQSAFEHSGIGVCRVALAGADGAGQMCADPDRPYVYGFAAADDSDERQKTASVRRFSGFIQLLI